MKCIKRFGLCIVAGLLTSMVVAWCITLWMPLFTRADYQDLNPRLATEIVGIPAQWPGANSMLHASGVGREEYVVSYIDDSKVSGLGLLPGDYMIRVYQAGYPARCFEYVHCNRQGSDNESGQQIWRGTMSLPSTLRPEFMMIKDRQYATFLPKGILLGGMLKNTLVYAIWIGLLMSVYISWRTHYRRSKFLCTQCGMPRIRGGGSCLECNTRF